MTTTNHTYPDVLGYITGGERHNVNVIQAAMTVRPFAVRAGSPFEVLVLLQNATDVPAEVRLKLSLPDRDQKRKQGRFTTERNSVIVDLQPAEVGYALIPAGCEPDTTPGAGYEVQVDLNVRVKGKPTRVRHVAGGEPLDLSRFAKNKVNEIEDLKRLRYATATKRRSRLASTLNVMPGSPGKVPELKASWNSLWTLIDTMTEVQILERYRGYMLKNLLPELRRDVLFEPLLAVTTKRFTQGGFELDPIEAYFIAKVLTLIMEFAAPEWTGHGAMSGKHYCVSPWVKQGAGSDYLVDVPHWFRTLLNLMRTDPRIIAMPEQTVTQDLYLPLVRDTMEYCFDEIETLTGRNMGTDAEKKAYIIQVVKSLENGSGTLTFGHVYLPLVLGGIAIHEWLTLPGEKPQMKLLEMHECLRQRQQTEYDDDTEPVFSIAEALIQRLMTKHGGLS